VGSSVQYEQRDEWSGSCSGQLTGKEHWTGGQVVSGISMDVMANSKPCPLLSWSHDFEITDLSYLWNVFSFTCGSWIIRTMKVFNILLLKPVLFPVRSFPINMKLMLQYNYSED
jgi:hypothetical protein